MFVEQKLSRIFAARKNVRSMQHTQQTKFGDIVRSINQNLNKSFVNKPTTFGEYYDGIFWSYS
jgi:hypothetical protein